MRRTLIPMTVAALLCGYALTAAEGSGPEVARSVSQAGFALHALYPERRDLETVFAEAGAATAVEEVRHAA